MASMDTYQLKWHSHGTHLNTSVASLLRSDRFTDVVLCTLDGAQVPAHKFVLSSCSIYLCNLFENQLRGTIRMGNNMIYVVLPPEIASKALHILVEYMYKGETTVSTEILDTVLKAGEVLKVRGLWRQSEAETNELNIETNKQTQKPEDMITKITVKKDDKLLQTLKPVQQQNMTRPMFIGPPKLVFIKTNDGNTVGLRPIAPKPSTMLVTPMEKGDKPPITVDKCRSNTPEVAKESTPPRIVKKPEKIYGKRARIEKPVEEEKPEKTEEPPKEEKDTKFEIPLTKIKDEPLWNDDPEEDDRSIAEMFHTEMNIKSETIDESEQNKEEETLEYSPLTCELCSEVFTLPAAWVRHIQAHADADISVRRRKKRSNSDDNDETLALLRCDLCQKHFLNPAEWVRHIQSTHTEVELALSNNSAPPTRHNRFTDGAQNKMCEHCNKMFPSHASMVIHMRTHTGERPFICGLCNKGFNVKSNLLRHLRTLHDHHISTDNMDFEEEVTPVSEAPSTSSSSTPSDKSKQEGAT